MLEVVNVNFSRLDEQLWAQRCNGSVYAASDGNEAIEPVRELRPEVVSMDGVGIGKILMSR